MDTLISNVTVVTMNEQMEVLFGAYLGVTEGKISYIGKKAPEEKPSTIIDGTGMVVMPGLINCHTHLATTALRSCFDDLSNREALENLLLDDYFAETMKSLVESWREVVAYAVKCGVPMPAFSSALSYFDGYTTECLPANLLQAQRDYFGAHTYERTDMPRGQFFHTNWTGHGGDTAASTYNA